MSSPALPLTPIVDVTVAASPQLGTPPPLNQGIIIGQSTVIPTFGGSGVTRCRQYGPGGTAALAGMLNDGFTITSPEYIGAEEYFAQVMQSQYVWIGRQDLTSLQTVIPHSGNAGTGYAVNDVVAVVQSGGTGGKATVTTIGSGGVVTGLSVITSSDGTGYSTATGLTTTGGSGTGLEVDITAVGESALVAFTNCRLASATWYVGIVLGAAAADHEAILLYVQGLGYNGNTYYYGVTSDAAALNNTTGNVLATCKAAGYQFGALIYATTQNGAYPNNVIAAGTAAMGYEMGANTQLANSYFTMWGKQLIGVIPEPLTQAQINVIQGNNGNVYVGYVDQYSILQPGVTPSGLFIDQILNRQLLCVNLAFEEMNLLVSVPSVPQTDPGEAQLIHVANTVLQQAVNEGYLAGGTYEGVQPFFNLVPGSPLPDGFQCNAYPYSTQTAAAKAARQAMPIYIVINEAGAVQSLVIQLNVNL